MPASKTTTQTLSVLNILMKAVLSMLYLAIARNSTSFLSEHMQSFLALSKIFRAGFFFSFSGKFT